MTTNGKTSPSSPALSREVARSAPVVGLIATTHHLLRHLLSAAWRQRRDQPCRSTEFQRDKNRAVEAQRDVLLAAQQVAAPAPAAMLLDIKGIGPEFAAILWSEGLFRHFDNRGSGLRKTRPFLKTGFLGHVRMRFVHLDPPGRIKSWKI